MRSGPSRPSSPRSALSTQARYTRRAYVFTALDLTPFDAVRAVILGMDPYAKAGQARGLAFSIRPGSKPYPTSLRNILNELEHDLREPANRDADR